MRFAATVKKEEIVHPQENHDEFVVVAVKPVLRRSLHQKVRQRANPYNADVYYQNVPDCFKLIRLVLLPLKTSRN